MDNAAIFIYPGEAALRFLLSLIGYTPGVFEPIIQSVASFLLAAIIWILMIKFFLRLASKALGLDQQGQRR